MSSQPDYLALSGTRTCGHGHKTAIEAASCGCMLWGSHGNEGKEHLWEVCISMQGSHRVLDQCSKAWCWLVNVAGFLPAEIDEDTLLWLASEMTGKQPGICPAHNT